MLRRGCLALVLLIALAPIVHAAPAAPAFRMKLLDSQRVVDSRDLLGKTIVVLRFEASYCKTCGREAQAFGRLVERYHARGVEFIAVHVQDTATDTRRFMRRHNVTYPVALDPRLTIGNRFGFKSTPYTVVIDRKGEMIARLRGASGLTRLPRILDDALATRAPSRRL